MTTKELIIKNKEEDIEKRNQIVMENQGLVYSIASKYKHLMDFETAVQVGNIGLIIAVEKFDESFGAKLGTYAFYYIDGEIKKHLRDLDEKRTFVLKRDDYLIRIEMAKAIEEIRNEKGKTPTFKEIAEKIGVEEKRIEQIYELEGKPINIDDKAVGWREAKDLPVADVIKDENIDLEDQIIKKITIEKAIQKLDPKLQKIIELRYFKDYTQKEIADAANSTQLKVSRAEKRALKQIKEALTGEKSKNTYSKKEELNVRRERMLKLLNENVQLKEIAKILNVSYPTVMRDKAALVKENRI